MIGDSSADDLVDVLRRKKGVLVCKPKEQKSVRQAALSILRDLHFRFDWTKGTTTDIVKQTLALQMEHRSQKIWSVDCGLPRIQFVCNIDHFGFAVNVMNRVSFPYVCTKVISSW